MADLQFRWNTNIQQVAQEIDTNLSRIGRAIQTASTGTGDLGLNLGNQLGQQLEQSIKGLGERLRLELLQGAKSATAQLRAGQTGIGDVQSRILGGGARSESNIFNKLTRAMEAESKALDAQIAGTPLASRRAELQGVLRNAGQQVLNNLRGLYREVAEDLAGARATAGIEGARLRTAINERQVRRVERDLGRATDLTGLDTERQRVLEQRGQGGRGDAFDDALARNTAALDESRVIEERLARELRANTAKTSRAGGGSGLKDPAGARADYIRGFGEVFFDEAGQAFTRGLDAEGNRIFRRLELGEGTVDRAVFEGRRDQGINDARARDAQLASQTEEQMREAQKRRERELEENARALALSTQLERQRARVGGPAIAGNFARDASGNLLEFTRGGQGLAPLPGPGEEGFNLKKRQAAQAAMARIDDQLRAEKERELAAQRRVTAQTSRRGGRGGGGGGPIDRFFERAFGDAGDGRGGGFGSRGLGAEDILTSGLSFTRYIISAAAFGVLFTAVTQVKEALLDAEDSLTDLEIALGVFGDTAEVSDRRMRNFADGLAQISRFTGENPGAAFDAAARGIRAFTDASATFDQQENIGDSFARAATQLSVITDSTLKDSSGDLIAAANVYEASFQRINDAVAAAKQSTGADPGEIAQGLAAVGEAAKAAGFNLEETTETIATVAARTDQTGRAAATRLSRIFNVFGGSGGQTAIAQLNSQLSSDLQIDQGGNVRQQVQQLAEVYDDLTESQRNLIKNAAGGTANSREFLTLITEFDTILGNVATSYENAGEATAEFNRKADDLRGEVNQIIGSLKGLVVELADAGVFTLFGVAVEAIEPLLNAVNTLLNLYNQLPTSLKAILALTLQAAAAQALYAKYKRATAGATLEELATSEQLNASLARQQALRTINEFNSGVRGGPLNRTPVGFLPVTGQGVRQAGTVGSAFVKQQAAQTFSSVRAGITSAMSRLGSFLASPTGLAVIGLAGIFAITRAAQISDRTGRALQETDRTLSDSVTFATLRDAAALRQEQATQLQELSKGFFGFAAAGGTEERADLLLSQADRLNALADSVEEFQQSQRSAGSDADFIDPTTAEGITDGLKGLEDAGRNASTRMDALRESVRRLSDAADQAATVLSGLQRFQFTQGLPDFVLSEFELSEELLEAPRSTWDVVADTLMDTLFGGGLPGQPTRTDSSQPGNELLAATRAAQEAFDSEALRETTLEFLQSTGGSLDPEQQGVLAETLADQLLANVDTSDLSEQELAQLRGNVLLAIKAQLAGITEKVDETARINAIISEQIALASDIAKRKATEASLFRDPRGGDLVGAQTLLAELEKSRQVAVAEGATAEQLQIIDDEIAAAQLALQDSRRKRIESATALAKSEFADSQDLERLRLDIDQVEQELSIATDQLAIEELTAQLNDLERQAADIILARAQAARKAALDPRDVVGAADAEVRSAQEAVDQFISRGDTSSVGFFDAVAQRNQARQSRVELQRQLNASHRLSHVDPRDAIGEARVQLRNAIEELEGSLSGTPEYYDNLRAVREAQLALADQELELASAQRALGVDPRSEVEQARVEIENVRDRLGNTLRGTTEYFQTLRELQDAQINFGQAVRDAESLARQVRIDLSDPVATAAEELLTARQNLNAAISEGAPEDVLNRLRVEEQQAQLNAEQAAFQQRFNDARTARDLGRISHAEYLAYLREEQARLQAIHDRTRQQQEQLDQVEGALKAARDAMDAQFNLGDIDVPTPFEARRSIAEQFGAQFGGASTVINEGDTTIIVDGADLAQVRRIIEESVGTRAVRRLTSTGRRA